jgi:predicted ATP-binding protein involved in virulence
MRLNRIVIDNFRCFEHLEIDFHPKLTVIVAENGIGKTAILEAITTGYGRLLTKLPGVGGIAPRITDIRIEHGESRAPFMNVLFEAETTAPRQSISWTIHKKRDSSAKTTKAIAASLNPEIAKIGQKQIDNYANELTNSIDDYSANLLDAEVNGNAYFLPVIAYYGTNRAILDDAQQKRNSKKRFSRFEALAGALQAKARFTAAVEWFATMEDLERREQQDRRDFDYRLPGLTMVRSAIVNALPVGFSDPRTKTRPVRFVIDRLTADGAKQTFRLNELSDGYRMMLGLVMDLARRMSQANSSLVQGGNSIMNPLDLPAIVLIDEVDLHLHPRWQQTVLTDLQRTFKGAQFIVTTHSPQVLTTVKAECIRGLKSLNGKIVVKDDYQFSEGAEAQLALEDILGVSPRPQNLEVVQQLNAYLDLVAKDQWDSEDAFKLREKLDAWGRGHETALLKADMDIRMRQYRRNQGGA